MSSALNKLMSVWREQAFESAPYVLPADLAVLDKTGLGKSHGGRTKNIECPRSERRSSVTYAQHPRGSFHFFFSIPSSAGTREPAISVPAFTGWFLLWLNSEVFHIDGRWASWLVKSAAYNSCPITLRCSDCRGPYLTGFSPQRCPRRLSKNTCFPAKTS